MTSLSPKILDALSTTCFVGHYHYVKMLIENANCTGATIKVGNRSGKQHLIPALKVWKAAHLEMTIVDTNLAYDNWGETKFKSVFGKDLVLRVLVHNDGVTQAAAPSTPATNLSTSPSTIIAVTATAMLTTATTGTIPPATVAGLAMVGTRAGRPAPSFAEMMHSLGPNFTS